MREWRVDDSPDLNPIEMPFSKMKAYLGKFSERSISDLCKRVRSFPALIATECMPYFRHAGYIRPESGRALLAGNTLLLTRIA